MKECSQVEARLGAYLDGELSSEERGQIQNHLEECSQCREAIAEIEEFLVLSESFLVPEVSEEEWQGTWRGIKKRVAHRENNTSQKIFPFWILAVAGVAAVLLLFLGLSYFSSPDTKENTPEKTPKIVVDDTPEKAPIDAVDNESHVQYLETGEGYTSTVDIPTSKKDMLVITINEKD